MHSQAFSVKCGNREWHHPFSLNQRKQNTVSIKVLPLRKISKQIFPSFGEWIDDTASRKNLSCARPSSGSSPCSKKFWKFTTLQFFPRCLFSSELCTFLLTSAQEFDTIKWNLSSQELPTRNILSTAYECQMISALRRPTDVRIHHRPITGMDIFKVCCFWSYKLFQLL